MRGVQRTVGQHGVWTTLFTRDTSRNASLDEQGALCLGRRLRLFSQNAATLCVSARTCYTTRSRLRSHCLSHRRQQRTSHPSCTWPTVEPGAPCLEQRSSAGSEAPGSRTQGPRLGPQVPHRERFCRRQRSQGAGTGVARTDYEQTLVSFVGLFSLIEYPDWNSAHPTP